MTWGVNGERFLALNPGPVCGSLATVDLEALKQAAEEKEEGYSEEKDRDLMTEDTRVKDERRDLIFSKGQSRRIWSELYKVVDSSDILIQVGIAVNSCVFLF